MNEEFRFLLYKAEQEDISVDALIKDETIWLTQKAMAELFNCTTDNISLHLKNIFAEGELDKISVTEKISATASDGKNYLTQFYNLDAIISVGYRVNSIRATHFRKWATSVLKEYMIKGFAIDDERLKQGKTAFGKDYFKELLERIRSIRASERRIWQQITDIYAECSIDYDKNAPTTKDFYAMVQNKFHYAITGKTAAEIVYDRADAQKNNMGLTTWEKSPDGKILKSDIIIAKNYLDEKEIKGLNNLVILFLDIAENYAERNIPMYMNDWKNEVENALKVFHYNILEGKGNISQKQAIQKATSEYEKYKVIQDKNYISDFDKLVKETEQLENK